MSEAISFVAPSPPPMLPSQQQPLPAASLLQPLESASALPQPLESVPALAA
jgi:hypothetical protein